ncbi:hypothetical protein STCU_11134 [Strigomonas culicis]|uniref:Uncharacterized protein n=1 Tax=Strigomonas culicis TaxID=28005 RepID=S9TI79_9TRYP|nr:hypothetical protein STCU_11134 [Strigomonas culicis]|eukprot:EPY16569.1 hypothetical protein STCU_11134 [Strigomonas culicis]
MLFMDKYFWKAVFLLLRYSQRTKLKESQTKKAVKKQKNNSEDSETVKKKIFFLFPFPLSAVSFFGFPFFFSCPLFYTSFEEVYTYYLLFFIYIIYVSFIFAFIFSLCACVF